MSKPDLAAIVVAAGRGLRAGSGRAKQYRRLAGRSVLARALSPFLAEAAIGHVLVVIAGDAREEYATAIAEFGAVPDRLHPPVEGGGTRQDSVRLGLEALAERGFAGTVLIHDAARPFCSAALVGRAAAACDGAPAAIPVLPVTDTIKRIAPGGAVADTPPRDALVAVQTPQAFDFAALLAAHRAARNAGLGGFTDDSAVMEWAGHRVATFPGEPENVKLTHPPDFTAAEQRLTTHLITRVGTGYDVHAFAEGDHVWLGGIRIPHGQGVLAHSDGDVALHALTDAVLGALADGDIGTHFPPCEERWRGASSDRFLAHAVTLVAARGGVIDHLDLSIVCEAPKVGPHRAAMRARIAAIAGIAVDQVGLKATTSEKLGFTGRREGLAALATATIRLPLQDSR